MVGYSGTPLPKKLGIPAGGKAYLTNVPSDLAPLFSGLELSSRIAPGLRYVHVFETERRRLAELFPKLAKALLDDGLMWVSWPKKASKRPTTIDENVARDLGLAAGLVDVKVCAVDEVWSGLKFVRRVADRKR
jgi:hypothetical protein